MKRSITKKYISMAIATVLFVSLLIVSPVPLIQAAEDTEPPVLVDAYPIKDNHEVGENVEYILIFKDAGGIDPKDVYPHFQMVNLEDSPPLFSTKVPMDDNANLVVEECQEILTAQQISDDYIAFKVVVPVEGEWRDNFMTGLYTLYSLSVYDISGNFSVYGKPTDNNPSGGYPFPEDAVLTFNVNNKDADLISPEVKSIEFSPAIVNAGEEENLTIIVKAKSADIDPAGFGYTLGLTDSDFYYQYYPKHLPEEVDILGPDDNGIITVRLTVTLPSYLPPGKYNIQQFSLRDKKGNETFNSIVHPPVKGFNDISVTIQNDDFTTLPIPEITTFEIMPEKDILQPGDNVRFKVGIESTGEEILDNANLYISTDNVISVNIDTPTLRLNEKDGFYYCDYQIPINLVHRQLIFNLGVHTEYENFYNVDTLKNGDELPKLRINSVFSGLDDITMLKGTGSVDDLKRDVTASNSLDGDMTSEITIANTPNFDTTGVYLVRYEVQSEQKPDQKYYGYRWLGITDTIPSNEGDPFITTSGSLNIIGTNEENVTIMASPDGNDYEVVDFSEQYTEPGYYKIIKNDHDDYEEDNIFTQSSFQFGATGLASVFFTGINNILSTNTLGMLTDVEDNNPIISRANSSELLCLLLPSADTQFTVTFDSLGGSGVAEIFTNYDSQITPPTEPVKAGYTFEGWFTEEECVNEWNFENDTIIADTTLYAKWSPQFVTLQDPEYNITVSGNLNPNARLVIGEVAPEHEGYHELISMIKEDDSLKLLLELDISIVDGECDEDHGLTITIPVGIQYEGMEVLICHWTNGFMSNDQSIVEDGNVTFTVSGLSPFAIFLIDESEPETEPEPEDEPGTETDPEDEPDTGARPEDEPDTKTETDTESESENKSDSDKKSEPEKEADSKIPKTGDNSNRLTLWLLLCLAALVGIASLIVIPRWRLRKIK